jgi:cell division protein FtsI (penicillin-binding protein 3)
MVVTGFAVIAGQLVTIGVNRPSMPRLAVAEHQFLHAAARPDIVDRNGVTLATDIRVYWLHADPAKILNADETAEQRGGATD